MDPGNWNNFWNRSRSTQTSWSKIRILDILNPYLKTARKVLDAGCGSGFFSAYFCDHGLATTAVDYSLEALNLTKANTFGRSQIVQADMRTDGFVDAVYHDYDLIFSDGLFEHFSLSDQDRIMSRFADILAPEGYIITFVPNLLSPWTIIRPFMMPEIKEKPFTPQKLKSLNQRNELGLIDMGGVNVLPWKFSPEKLLSRFCGMLLYSIAKKK